MLASRIDQFPLQSGSSSESTWYVAFVSIVFGLFIAVWIEPFAEDFSKPSIIPYPDQNYVFLLARSLITFFILICLWWWYAQFLGRICPAKAFLTYSYDFMSLAVFALGFRFWHHELVFPLAVIFGTLLMGGRLFRLKMRVKLGEVDKKAIKVAFTAIAIIVLFFLGMAGFFVLLSYGVPSLTPSQIQLAKATFQYGVIVVLLVSIIATYLAVRQVELQAMTIHSPSMLRDTVRVTAADNKAGKPSGSSDRTQRIGNRIAELAASHSERKNSLPLFEKIRDGLISMDVYLTYISSMYPIVIGFNRALIRSFMKLDHVSDWRQVRSMASQLHKEQEHNDLWRKMLRSYNIDDSAIYRDFLLYYDNLNQATLDQSVTDLISNTRRNVGESAHSIFTETHFPEAVVALYHQLCVTSTQKSINYWTHFGCQFGIEAIILDVVLTSVYPGVRKNSDLAAGPDAFEWWKRHAKDNVEPGAKKSTEEKHVELAKIALNNTTDANERSEEILKWSESTMLLFVETGRRTDDDVQRFRYTRYIKSAI